MTTYHVSLRDCETQTVVGYYNGPWTTDWCHAVALRKRDARKPTPLACAIVQAAIRLDPHDPKLANRLNNLALGRRCTGRTHAQRR